MYELLQNKAQNMCIYDKIYLRNNPDEKMFNHHDDVIKWKHFAHYGPSVWGIHRSPVNSLHKGQWRRALMFSLICVWINGWVNNRKAGDLRRYRTHYDVTVMIALVTTIAVVPFTNVD